MTGEYIICGCSNPFIPCNITRWNSILSQKKGIQNLTTAVILINITCGYFWQLFYQSENTMIGPKGTLMLCLVLSALYDPCSPLADD